MLQNYNRRFGADSNVPNNDDDDHEIVIIFSST